MRSVGKDMVMFGGRGCNGCNYRRELVLVDVSEVLSKLELGYDEEELQKKEANIDRYFKVKEEKQKKIRDLMDEEYLMEVQ